MLLQLIQGHSYDKIAEESSYVSGYLKIVGAKLWQELSQVLGQRINKKNFYAVLLHKLGNATNGLWPSPALSETSPISTGQDAAIAFPSGPVPLGSAFYVERPPIEARAFQAIAQPGCLLRLKSPRRYGRSSLLLRVVDQAKQLGYQTVSIDFKDADGHTLSDRS